MAGKTGARIDGHAEGIGGLFRDGVPAGGKAAIVGEHRVGDDGLGLRFCLGACIGNAGAILLDGHADRRAGQETVIGGVDIVAIGVSEAGSVLHAVLLKRERCSVG